MVLRTLVKLPRVLALTLGLPVATAVALAGLAAATPADPPAPNREAVLARLQRRYQETKSFSVKFTEEINPAGGVKRVREGTIYYRKPGRIRWTFGGEQSETIVSDGTDLYTYQPDLNQVIETPLARAFGSSSAAAFLLGIGNLSRDFDASMPAQAATDGLVHLTLRPKAGGDTMEVGLDPETADIRTLRVVDQLGDVTSFWFTDLRRNIALDDSLFVFKVPAGADIVQAPPSP